MLIDIHAHLTYEKFEKDIEEVINNFNGIVITNGTNVEDNRKVLELCKKYSSVKFALGIYPGHVIEMTEEELKKELKFIESKKPIAIGEVGLDGTYPEMEKQIFWLKEFIKLSNKLEIPIIVHTRKAEEKIIDVLEEMKAKKVVLHCFNGSMKLVVRAEKLGYSFSIPVIITYLDHFKELVKKVSITKLFTETDAPFLSNVKGERNEPKNVAITIKEIARLKNMDATEVENSILMNYKRMFG
jgi:TatD DNase family protein